MNNATHHSTAHSADIAAIRDGVKALCARFPGEYWRARDRERAYPGEFVQALTEAGYLACLIPEEYGGSGLGVTEPTAGTDTTAIRTTAERRGNSTYVVNGQKVWTSRAEHSDLMLLLARTTPREQVQKKTEGLSVFLIDMKAALNN